VVQSVEAFYRSVLDLEPEPSQNSARDTTQGYAARSRDRAQITRLAGAGLWCRGAGERLLPSGGRER
jgi:hypothetical protein